MATRTISKLEVCESLIREHRQMEALLDKLDGLLASLNPEVQDSIESLRALMYRIGAEINTHFACEEKVLFPGVSPYHSMVLMEVEHEALIALRDSLLELLRKDWFTVVDADQMREIGSRFISEMLDHIGREDVGIFPTCERSLSDDEKQDIMEEMDRIRDRAASTPTPTITRPGRSFDVLKMDLDCQAQRPVFSERLLDDNGLEIKHLIVKGGESLPSHWSPKQMTLVCLKGSGVFTANNQETELKAGVAVVMTPQLLHGVQANTDCHLLLLLR